MDSFIASLQSKFPVGTAVAIRTTVSGRFGSGGPRTKILNGIVKVSTPYSSISTPQSHSSNYLVGVELDEPQELGPFSEAHDGSFHGKRYFTTARGKACFIYILCTMTGPKPYLEGTTAATLEPVPAVSSAASGSSAPITPSDTSAPSTTSTVAPKTGSFGFASPPPSPTTTQSGFGTLGSGSTRAPTASSGSFSLSQPAFGIPINSAATPSREAAAGFGAPAKPASTKSEAQPSPSLAPSAATKPAPTFGPDAGFGASSTSESKPEPPVSSSLPFSTSATSSGFGKFSIGAAPAVASKPKSKPAPAFFGGGGFKPTGVVSLGFGVPAKPDTKPELSPASSSSASVSTTAGRFGSCAFGAISAAPSSSASNRGPQTLPSFGASSAPSKFGSVQFGAGGFGSTGSASSGFGMPAKVEHNSNPMAGSSSSSSSAVPKPGLTSLGGGFRSTGGTSSGFGALSKLESKPTSSTTSSVASTTSGFGQPAPPFGMHAPSKPEPMPESAQFGGFGRLVGGNAASGFGAPAASTGTAQPGFASFPAPAASSAAPSSTASLPPNNVAPTRQITSSLALSSSTAQNSTSTATSSPNNSFGSFSAAPSTASSSTGTTATSFGAAVASGFGGANLSRGANSTSPATPAVFGGTSTSQQTLGFGLGRPQEPLPSTSGLGTSSSTFASSSGSAVGSGFVSPVGGFGSAAFGTNTSGTAVGSNPAPPSSHSAAPAPATVKATPFGLGSLPSASSTSGFGSSSTSIFSASSFGGFPKQATGGSSSQAAVRSPSTLQIEKEIVKYLLSDFEAINTETRISTSQFAFGGAASFAPVVTEMRLDKFKTLLKSSTLLKSIDFGDHATKEAIGKLFNEGFAPYSAVVEVIFRKLASAVPVIITAMRHPETCLITMLKLSSCVFQFNSLNGPAWFYLTTSSIDCDIEDASAAELATSVRAHPTLKTLNLRSNKITTEGAKALFKALSYSTCQITSLNLSKNLIDGLIADTIAKYLASPVAKLTALNLNSNQLGKGHSLATIASAAFSNPKIGSLKILQPETLDDFTLGKIVSNLIQCKTIIEFEIQASGAITHVISTVISSNLFHRPPVPGSIMHKSSGNPATLTDALMRVELLSEQIKHVKRCLPEQNNKKRGGFSIESLKSQARLIERTAEFLSTGTGDPETERVDLSAFEESFQALEKLQADIKAVPKDADEQLKTVLPLRDNQREESVKLLKSAVTSLSSQIKSRFGTDTAQQRAATMKDLETTFAPFFEAPDTGAPPFENPSAVVKKITNRSEVWLAKYERLLSQMSTMTTEVAEFANKLDNFLLQMNEVASGVSVIAEVSDAANSAFSSLSQQARNQDDERAQLEDVLETQRTRLLELEEDQRLAAAAGGLITEMTTIESNIRGEKRRRAQAEAEVRHFEHETPRDQAEKQDFENAKQMFFKSNSAIETLSKRRAELLAELHRASRVCPEIPILHPTLFAVDLHNKGLSDKTKASFSSIEPLPGGRGNVYLAKDHDGEEWVLKRFSLDAKTSQQEFGSSRSYGSLSRELGLLQRLRHPLIVPVECVFRDGPDYFIQMPRFRLGTLRDWLSAAPRDFETKKRVLLLVIQAISFIHHSGVCHRDIKLENILMRDDSRPVIADFDVSRDLNASTESAVTISDSTIVGTFDYMAPELVAKESKSTAASDMYALGVVLFKAFTSLQSVPVLLPSQESPELPSGMDPNLVDLLSILLQRNPSKRPSAEEVVVHPFFTTISEPVASDSSLTGSERRIAAFRTFANQLQAINSSRRSSPVLIRFPRGSFGAKLLWFLDPKVHQLRWFNVQFEGEAGIDGGGLTASAYRLAFESAVKAELGLFEQDEGSSVYLPTKKPSNSQVLMLRNVGYLLVRCLIEQRPVGIRLAPSVYKYLLGKPVTQADFSTALPSVARQLQKIMSTSAVDAFGLDFSDFNPTDSRPLTTQNRLEYIRCKISHDLFESRRTGLEALKAGFFSIEQAKTQLEILAPSDLSVLICGHEFISAEMIIQELVFERFPVGSRTPDHLKSFLRSKKPDILRKFLVFVTEYTAIPAEGLWNARMNKRGIQVHCQDNSDKLPSVSTCFFTLKLPDYQDEAKLSSKLMIAMEEQSFLLS